MDKEQKSTLWQDEAVLNRLKDQIAKMMSRLICRCSAWRCQSGGSCRINKHGLTWQTGKKSQTPGNTTDTAVATTIWGDFNQSRCSTWCDTAFYTPCYFSQRIKTGFTFYNVHVTDFLCRVLWWTRILRVLKCFTQMEQEQFIFPPSCILIRGFFSRTK